MPASAFLAFFTISMSLLNGLSNKPDPMDAVNEATKGQMVDAKDNQENIPLIYGRQRVPVNICYMVTTGTANNELHLVGIIGEGEINGIHQEGGVDQIWLDDKLYTEYGALISYQVYTGTSTQTAHAALVTATAGMAPEMVWNDAMRNTAYIYMKLTYDRDKFQGLPNITVDVEGLKVLDTRTSTTGYSANPALCAYDFITRSSRRGGMGIDTARVVTTTVDDAANFCDTKSWTIGLVLRDTENAVEMLQSIIKCYRGDVIYSETQFKLVYRDWDSESVVMNLGEADIVEAGGVSSLTIAQPSVFDTPNSVRVKFCNADNKFITDDLVVTDSSAITQDGDQREETVDLPGVTSYEHGLQLAHYNLERFRVNKTIGFTSHSRGLVLEPHDLITITHTFPGWNGKIFRIESVTVTPAMEVAISAVEESSSFYNDTYDLATHSFHDTTLPDPSAIVPNVVNVTVTEETYYWASRTYTRLLIACDAPTVETYPWWDHAEVWVSQDGGTTYKSIGNTTGDFQIDPVEEGSSYTIKLVSVNIWGGKENFAGAYSVNHVVVGKTGVPTTPDPITVTASGDIITIMTDDITEQDIVGYELRLGDSWNGSIYVGTYQSAQIRLGGFKPGNFTFWLAPIDNRGKYSGTKRSGSVTVLGPANYTARSTSWEWDFTQGVFSNSEKSTASSTNCLIASHSYANGYGNLFFTGGLAGWTTAGGISAATYSTGSTYGVVLTSSAVDPVPALYAVSTNVHKACRHNLHFTYRNAPASTGWYYVYDLSNTTYLAVGEMPQSTAFSTFSTYIDTEWNTTGIQLGFGLSTGSSAQTVYVNAITLTPATITEGKWQSPIYDFTSAVSNRVWGDFRTVFSGSSAAWAALPSSNTWASIGSSSNRWYQVINSDQSGFLESTIRWGDSTDALNNSAKMFNLLAPEFTARYCQVEVSIKDPDMLSNLKLLSLNMTAKYWST